MPVRLIVPGGVRFRAEGTIATHHSGIELLEPREIGSIRRRWEFRDGCFHLLHLELGTIRKNG